MVHSFDIFDTVLTRVWARPTDLFLCVGRRLELNSASFKVIRTEAEGAVRRDSGHGEVTLEEIYCLVAKRLGWNEAQREDAMRIELEIENSSLMVVPEMAGQVHRQRGAGKTICFISDIYLPEADIQEWLFSHGLMVSGDVLFTSERWCETKSTGKLFLRAMEEQKLKPEQLLHTGDNYHSDVDMSRRLGIQARHFSATQFNRYEHLIADCCGVPEEQRSLAAGAARLARLDGWSLAPHKQVLWETGASLVGPVFFSYVLWCLRKAEQEGLKRLYFIARDGQILCRIAKMIVRAFSIPIDCCYLYGSRQAWHLPGVTTLSEGDLQWILLRTHRADLYTIFRRVNLAPERFAGTLQAAGFHESDWAHPLTEAQVLSLPHLFLQSPIKNAIEAEALAARETAAGYLRQEGFFDGTPSGIVDLGWGGTMQRSLGRLLNASDRPVDELSRGFYFHVSPAGPVHPHERFFSYLKEIGQVPGRDQFWHSVAIMEIFAAADHGGTMGYKVNGTKYSAVLSAERDEAACQWGVSTLQDGCVAFVERYLGALQRFGLQAVSLDPIISQLLGIFVEHPTQSEANAFGCIMVNSDQASERAFELAPKLNLVQCLRYIFHDIRTTGEAWTPGIAARSGSLVGTLLRARLAIRKVRRIFEHSRQ